MIREKSCGAVIYYRDSKILYLVEQMIQGHYALCKGHVEGNETEMQTAAREIREETGLEVTFIPGFREKTEYSPYSGCIKEVVYFLAESKGKANRVQPEEVSALLWLEYNQAMQFLTYESDKKILANARKFIK